MATGTDKFLNYNGLVKLIGLIKKRINDAISAISWKSNVFVKDVVGIHTTNQQDSAEANITFVEQSAVVTLGKLDGTGTDTTHNITFTDARYDPVDPSRGNGLMSVEDKVKLDNLSATGAGKGANLVKYDSTVTATAGSVAEAIKNLQGAVGGGDLVKSVDNATQDNSTNHDDNIIPNNPRTGNYTKADGTSGTFTYYDTRYSLVTASNGMFAGLNGLMSANDKEKLDNLDATGANKGANLVKYDSTAKTTTGSVAEAIKNLQDTLDNLNSSTVLLSSNITIDSTSTGNVQDALSALNKLAEANKSAISTLQSGGLTRAIVTALPTGTAIKANVIYMILASNDTLNSGDPSTSATTTPYGTNNNSYNEYMYINNAWERIGSTEVNLDIDPITNDEIDTAWSITGAAA